MAPSFSWICMYVHMYSTHLFMYISTYVRLYVYML